MKVPDTRSRSWQGHQSHWQSERTCCAGEGYTRDLECEIESWAPLGNWDNVVDDEISLDEFAAAVEALDAYLASMAWPAAVQETTAFR
jgi:hypothetical protein